MIAYGPTFEGPMICERACFKDRNAKRYVHLVAKMTPLELKI